MANGVDAFNILAPFTNKAAKEMKERWSIFGEMVKPAIYTSVLSLCICQGYFDLKLIDWLSRNFTIYDTDDAKSVVKKINELNLDRQLQTQYCFTTGFFCQECTGRPLLSTETIMPFSRKIYVGQPSCYRADI